jgi:hypothetical protein
MQLKSLKESGVTVRLKIENSREGIMATISQRDDAGKVIGRPSVTLVGTKDEAKQQAKSLARSLGLKVYGIVDKTGTVEETQPWLVPGVGESL